MTGGVTGLGRELVLQIISKGAQVVVLDILEPLEEDLNTVGLTHYKCDVSDPQDVLRTQKLVRNWGSNRTNKQCRYCNGETGIGFILPRN